MLTRLLVPPMVVKMMTQDCRRLAMSEWLLSTEATTSQQRALLYNNNNNNTINNDNNNNNNNNNYNNNNKKNNNNNNRYMFPVRRLGVYLDLALVMSKLNGCTAVLLGHAGMVDMFVFVALCSSLRVCMHMSKIKTCTIRRFRHCCHSKVKQLHIHSSTHR
jgi:hypothetical protein